MVWVDNGCQHTSDARARMDGRQQPVAAQVFTPSAIHPFRASGRPLLNSGVPAVNKSATKVAACSYYFRRIV